MKTFKNHFRSWGILFLALLPLSTILYAQPRSLDKEVLVYIMPDSLEMADAKATITLQNASIRSSALAANLQKTRAISIAKAFPNWRAKDSINGTQTTTVGMAE